MTPYITESHAYKPKYDPIFTIKQVDGSLSAGRYSAGECCFIMATVALLCLRLSPPLTLLLSDARFYTAIPAL